MKTLLLIADINPGDAAWARWLQDVMTSWPAQLVILLLFAGLAVLLVRHAAREWEGGVHNRYLQAGLAVAGVFFVLQFLFASSLVGDVSWPAWPFVIEFVVLFALWLYAFVRFMTTQRSGPGDDESRDRGAALDRVIKEAGDQGGTA
jgi:membrane protein implicated in regulation of membrane protease activity